MGARNVMLWAGAVVAAVFLIGKSNSPMAGSCIVTEEDKDWSFLTFYNNCEKPINAVFCNKMSVGELGKLFGYDTGEWDCRNYHVEPKHSFMTIKWVNENSSVASHLLSTSRYQTAACKAPYRPRFKEGAQYACEKS